MAKKKKIVYNEHDQNQVREMLQQRKKRRKKRRLQKIGFVFVVLLIIGFFVSDFSKIQSISIQGTNRVSEKTIKDSISLKVHSSFIFFNDTNKTKKEIEKIPLIKEADVSKDLLGNISIKVTETDLIGYAYIDNVLYVVDEKGSIVEDQEQTFLQYVKRCPQLHNFNMDILEKFVKEYYQLPTEIRNQVSDIKYAPQSADEYRCEFYMDNDNVLFLRLDKMVSQLDIRVYTQVMNNNPNGKYFDFVGKHCYVSETLEELNPPVTGENE